MQNKFFECQMLINSGFARTFVLRPIPMCKSYLQLSVEAQSLQRTCAVEGLENCNGECLEPEAVFETLIRQSQDGRNKQVYPDSLRFLL